MNEKKDAFSLSRSDGAWAEHTERMEDSTPFSSQRSPRFWG